MPLTDDARRELREAIGIVREDRFEKYIRTNHFPPKAKEEGEKEKDGPTPPPGKEEENEKVNDEPKRSAYWGELLSD